MIWISQLFFAAIITVATGTIGLGFWLLGKSAFSKWNPNLVYITLRLVSLMYILPVGFLAVKLTIGEGYIQIDHIWQMNFYVAGLMKSAFFISGMVWFVITLRNVRNYRKRNREWYRIYKESIVVEEEQILREFRRICTKLRIRRKIRLYWNENIVSPMVSGFVFPKVLLPLRNYTKEQLAVIFYHELTHYKNCDVLYKLCCICIGAIGHFHFFSNLLLEQLNEWSEYYCDVRAVEAMSDEFTPRQYFESIIDLMSEMPEAAGEGHALSMLYESRHSLERRIDYMKNYKKVSQRAKCVTFLIAFLFTVMSVSTAYAAGSGLSVINDEIYKMTESVKVVSELKEGQKTICIPAGKDTDCEFVYENTRPDISTITIGAGVLTSFTWTVTPGTRHVSDKMYVKAGQSIVTSCSVVPGTQTYWLGIMDPGNDVYCVEGTESMAHTFVVSKTGYYRVMVQNRGTQDISASGSFYYY